MAYDGIAVAAAVKELNDRLLAGSITKVAQPERDELLLTLKCSRQQVRLAVSANASTPMVYIREDNSLSPVTAPNFCMALRKHIGGGRIRAIFQPSARFSELGERDQSSGADDRSEKEGPEEHQAENNADNRQPGSTTGNTDRALANNSGGSSDSSLADNSDHNAAGNAADYAAYRGLERIIVFAIEHYDEMGDLSIKYLITEIMGKHSNIILTKSDLTIIDSIKHISHMTSSVREVLPGRTYFIPETAEKADPVTLYKDREAFTELIKGAPILPVFRKIYMSVTGFSPAMSEELLYRAGIDSDLPNNELTSEQTASLYDEFAALMNDVEAGNFEPCIIYEGSRIAELSGVRLRSLEGGSFKTEAYESMSEVIRLFYSEKDKQNRINSKSEDIRHVLKTLTERAAKKQELLEKQYADTDKRDKYRVYGELLNIYGYSLKGGEESIECENYYDDNRIIRIPLDRELSAAENAKRYFDKYQKLKRTREAVGTQLEECRNMLFHLDSIANSLTLCESEADLNELRREMSESGYIGKHAAAGSRGGKDRKAEAKSKPLHFVSSDGIDIYVGRNNFQNEELDFKLADNNDWWFHAKNIPGSHVIAKTGNRELPDKTCLEAAALAAYYSKAGNDNKDAAGNIKKVEVDYVRKKELKRVPGAAPGFVIYHTNYSIMIEPRETIGYN